MRWRASIWAAALIAVTYAGAAPAQTRGGLSDLLKALPGGDKAPSVEGYLNQIQQLQSALSASQDETRALSGKLNTAQTENQGLLSRLAGLQGALNASQDENQGLLSQLSGLQEALSASRGENQGLLSRLSGLQNALAASRQENGGLLSRMGDLQATLGSISSENEGLLSRLADMQSKLTARASAAEGLSGQVSSLTQALAGKDSEITRLLGQLTSLRDADAANVVALAGMSEQVRELQTALAENEKQRAEMSAALTSLGRQKKEEAARLKTLEAALASARSGLVAEKSKAMGYVRRIAGLEHRLGEQSGTIGELGRQLDQAKDVLAAADGALRQERDRNAAMVDEIGTLRHRQRQDAAAAAGLKEELAALDVRFTALQGAAARSDAAVGSLQMQRIVIAVLLLLSLIANVVFWRRSAAA